MQPEYIVAGLGNPGTEYALTRHNAGFMALDLLAREKGFALSGNKFEALCGTFSLQGVPCLFLKPQTYMNRSGRAIAQAMRFYKLPPERLIVLCDDVSFAPGVLRIRTKGSAGGHKGLNSIIEHLQSQEFCRIKLGVGQKPPAYDLADWVLGKFPPQDLPPLREALDRALQALPLLVTGRIQQAMNACN